MAASDRELVDALGPALADWVFDCVRRKIKPLLREDNGGTRWCFYVPLTPTGKLVSLFGKEAAARLSAAFGGETVFICKRAVFPSYSRQCAVALRAKRVPVRMIAKALSVSERSVHRYFAQRRSTGQS